MDWTQIFEGFGVPVAMLIYFIWHSQKSDEELKAARTEFIKAEKDSLLKYAELTKQVTAVISTVQQEINTLTDQVAELAAIIREQKK